MPDKIERNKKQEHRLGIQDFRAARKEVHHAKRQMPLPFESENKVPINHTQRLRTLKVEDIRSLLDLRNIDGTTALQILTAVVFVKQSYSLSRQQSPSRRSNREMRPPAQNKIKDIG